MPAGSSSKRERIGRSLRQYATRWKKVGVVSAAVLAFIAATTGVAVHEGHTSRWQAQWLSRIAGEARYELRPGASEAIAFPTEGPFNHRLGYARVPEWTERLLGQGFEISAQARWSPRMQELHQHGLFVPYREKTRTGLELLGCRRDTLYQARYPEQGYARFQDVPPVVREMLVYIENRRLLEPVPTRNPAIDWQRLGRAVIDQGLRSVDASHAAGGGSTLATQIEKYRHSPGGRTGSAWDKLVQMASASLRGYLDGPDTTQRRQEILLDYLNTVPLSASPGFGEVIGFADALWVWYGRRFEDVNGVLRQVQPGADGRAPAAPVGPVQAQMVKEALSLLVAQRRPAYYLSAEGLKDLRELTDGHLRLLAQAGVIPASLRDAALPLPLKLRRTAPDPAPPSFTDAKAANALRARLLHMLGLPGAYDLDRSDLRARSTIAGDVQREVTQVLQSLGTREGARAAGLYAPFLLRERDDPGRIAYSFTLFESDGERNLLRVQTDNLDQPFDVNEGARLDMGSTAKLRTLVTYLELVAALHQRWSGLDARALSALRIRPDDAISHWARAWLLRSPDRGLRAMLDAAMQRTYSASPGERFVTGGGVHTFGNFDSRDNGKVMTMQEAMSRSVNLPFIRLMRDMVRHIVATDPAIDPEVAENPAHPARRAYLDRFVESEGSLFMSRFHAKYESLAPDALVARLMEGVAPVPVRVANVFFVLHPEGSADELRRFLQRWLPQAADSAEELHAKHGPGQWPLHDRGYLTKIHPLELWVAGYLLRHPGAGLTETLAAGADERQEVYGWLFKTTRQGGQDKRIRQQLEVQAFERILQSWRRLGYPFERMTPSYASSLGASGDRPAALAELASILNNGGLRLPTVRVEAIEAAPGTPWETHFQRRTEPAERVLAPEVAEVARDALRRVVEEGTGRRTAGALTRADGTVIPIGGKTGTGDHRVTVRGPGGQVSHRVVSRSASFVFVIGDRWHGTLMAHVPEPHAASYAFTSALPTQVLNAIAPKLQPLVEQPGCGRQPAVVDEALQVVRVGGALPRQ